MQDTIAGNARLTKTNHESFKDVKHIYGKLIVAAKGNYHLPNLLTVKGISVLKHCGLTLPNCESINGDITVGYQGRLTVEGKAQNIRHIRLKEMAGLRLGHTTEIGGLTSEDADHIDLPSLTRVIAKLCVTGKIVLPKCTMIKAVISGSNSLVQLPNCTAVDFIYGSDNSTIQVVSLAEEDTHVEDGSGGEIVFKSPAPLPKIDYQSIQRIFNATAIAMF